MNSSEKRQARARAARRVGTQASLKRAIRARIKAERMSRRPHRFQWSRMGTTLWCLTCKSPYCDLA